MDDIKKTEINDLNDVIVHCKAVIKTFQSRIRDAEGKMNTSYQALQLLGEEKPECISDKYLTFKIKSAVLDILKEGKLTSQQVFERLLKHGFISNSSNIKRDVHIILFRLVKDNKVIREKKETNNESLFSLK